MVINVSDVKNLEKVYYVIDGDDIVGHLKLYAIGTLPSCFEDTYKFYLNSYLKEKIKSNIDLDDYLNTFRINGIVHFEDFLGYNENSNRYDIRLNSLGIPYFDNKTDLVRSNRFSRNLTSLVKHKTQFYNFIIDVDKPETNRLFYDNIKDDFLVVDCNIKEIEKLYTSMVKVRDGYGFEDMTDILDRDNNPMSVRTLDIFKFCKKELDIIKTQNNLYHKNLRLFDRLSMIFFSEGFNSSLIMYQEGLR